MEGNKPTRYFCSLKNRNFKNRSVSFLEKLNGEIIDEQSDMLREVQQFYETLYTEKDVDEINLTEKIPLAPKLENRDHEYLERELTFKEAALILHGMNNNKSPGLDGFTVEFFNFFFQDIGHF